MPKDRTRSKPAGLPIIHRRFAAHGRLAYRNRHQNPRDGSTGVYWVAAYEVLESRGLEAVLANAREARAVPGRKSDVNDAQWLQRLHACGLLRASFRPKRDIAELRSNPPVSTQSCRFYEGKLTRNPSESAGRRTISF